MDTFSTLKKYKEFRKIQRLISLVKSLMMKRDWVIIRKFMRFRYNFAISRKNDYEYLFNLEQFLSKIIESYFWWKYFKWLLNITKVLIN